MKLVPAVLGSGCLAVRIRRTPFLRSNSPQILMPFGAGLRTHLHNIPFGAGFNGFGGVRSGIVVGLLSYLDSKTGNAADQERNRVGRVSLGGPMWWLVGNLEPSRAAHLPQQGGYIVTRTSKGLRG